MRTIFIGDSVTDCNRLDNPPHGDGYVREIVALGSLDGDVINVGTSGHRLVDLVARWDRDVLANEPDLVSIAIGINDTWRRYDDNDATSVEDFEHNYRGVLERTDAAGAMLVLCEPFLLPVDHEMQNWREDLDPKIEVVHRLASEFNAVLVPFDAHFRSLSVSTPMAELAADGIHPTPLGHRIMASLWMQSVRRD